VQSRDARLRKQRAGTRPALTMQEGRHEAGPAILANVEPKLRLPPYRTGPQF
jgi:hypothetical protein